MSHNVNELNVGLQSSVTLLYNWLVDKIKIDCVCSQISNYEAPATEDAEIERYNIN